MENMRQGFIMGSTDLTLKDKFKYEGFFDEFVSFKVGRLYFNVSEEWISDNIGDLLDLTSDIQMIAQDLDLTSTIEEA